MFAVTAMFAGIAGHVAGRHLRGSTWLTFAVAIGLFFPATIVTNGGGLCQCLLHTVAALVMFQACALAAAFRRHTGPRQEGIRSLVG